MVFQYKMQKILTIKQNEKDKLLGDYNNAVKKFEDVGTKLYEYLKQKEEVEDYLQSQIQSGLNILEIQRLQRLIHSLEQTILQQQQLVIVARQEMELKEKQLLDKNIEVKKYDKMKQKAFENFIQQEKSEESKLMDEISIQQYMNRSNKVFL